MVRVKGISSFKKMRLNWPIERHIRVAVFAWYAKRCMRNDIKEAIKEAARRFEEELTSALAEYY